MLMYQIKKKYIFFMKPYAEIAFNNIDYNKNGEIDYSGNI